MTIEMSLLYGAIAGLIIGTLVPQPKFGCIVLLAIPIAMVAYVFWWQAAHPENLRSTSGLDFLFVPLWPSLGAVCGFVTGRLLRSLFMKR